MDASGHIQYAVRMAFQVEAMIEETAFNVIVLIASVWVLWATVTFWKLCVSRNLTISDTIGFLWTSFVCLLCTGIILSILRGAS